MTRHVAKAPESAGAFAWEIIDHTHRRYVLCHWAESFAMTRERPPLPEARIVPVVIVRETDYRRLLRAAAGKREAKPRRKRVE
jgi:hypothetical protein